MELVQDKEEHIECVTAEESVALPLLESALYNSRNDCDSANSNTNREVEHEVNSVYRERLASEYCAKGKNEGCVDDVSSDDVTNGERVLFLADSGKSCYKLGQRGTESNYGKSNDGFADADVARDIYLL